MTTLPSKTTLTDASTTEGQFRGGLDDLIDYLTENFSTAGGGVVVIENTTGVAAVPLTVKGEASQTADILRVRDSADTDLLRVVDTGEVQIGTTDESAQLNVGGAIQSRASAPAIELYDTDDTAQARLILSGGAAILEGEPSTALALRGYGDTNLTGVTIKIGGTAETVVTRDVTETLTNKTLTSPVIGGTGLTVGTGAGTDAVIDEGGIDRSSASAETFNVENSGAGAMTLQVDGVAVPTISSTSTLTNKTLTDPVIDNIDGTGTVTITPDGVTAGASITTTALTIPQKLVHEGDTDTYVTFATNEIDLVSGGVTGLYMVPAALTLGDPAQTITLDSDSVQIGSAIIHNGDVDTKIEFLTDNITMDAGGVEFLNATASALTLGDVTSIPYVTIEASDSVTMNAINLEIPNRIRHIGDTDTYWSFSTDGISFYTGGSRRFGLGNSGVQFNSTGETVSGGILATISDTDEEVPTSGAVVDYVTGQRTLYRTAGEMVPTTTNGAESGSSELATNDIMKSGLDFDAATAEKAQFVVQMPKGWNEGTIVAQFIWSTAATAGTGNVVWGLKAGALSDDDAMDAALGTGVTVTDGFLLADDMHISAETAAITVGGSPAAEDAVVFEVYRDAASGSDTYTQDARLLGVKIHYTVDAPTDD